MAEGCATGETELTRPRRHRHADVCVDERFAPRGDAGVAGGVQVVAGREGAAAGREAGFVGELLDLERRDLLLLLLGGTLAGGLHGFVVGLDALRGR